MNTNAINTRNKVIIDEIYPNKSVWQKVCERERKIWKNRSTSWYNFLLVCREETGYKSIQDLPVSDAISPRIKGNIEAYAFVCMRVCVRVRKFKCKSSQTYQTAM